MLGGAAAKNIDAPGFGPNGNTCASRLSVAFTNGGTPISLAIACAVIALWRSNKAHLRRSRHATSIQHWARRFTAAARSVRSTSLFAPMMRSSCASTSTRWASDSASLLDPHDSVGKTQKYISWNSGEKLPAFFFAVGRGTAMRWYHYFAYFFGGAFLANTLPHLGNGISGHAFQSPFASPPGVGLSSSLVNVLWGFFNLVVAYLLVCRVGSFNLRKTQHVLVLGAGILIMSLMLAHTFGPFHGGQ
jgi:hypothetical protein